MPFKIIRSDITKISADAIVNTANQFVEIGDGVESAKYIIQASSPCWQGGKNNEDALLRQYYDESLSLAVRKGCKSIVFPLLATGTYAFPKELAIQIAIDAFTEFLRNHDMEIILVVSISDTVKISGKLVDEVSQFIDDAYVGKALEVEYENEGFEELELESLEFSQEVGSFGALPSEDDLDFDCTINQASIEKDNLDDILMGIYKESFDKYLRRLINRKGLKNSEVYAAANISKQYFSKLLKGKIKPSKEKMLALAVGLKLNLDETVDFLNLAGYSLSPISQTDAIVEYFIEHRDYNVLKIDIVLFDYGLDPLSN
ncbi:macro domain-containing protein [Peptostreptococcus equinus]|uniref:Macro domain-containing protein n=1 Tax=Peptostreptococcus equinus TaxID=3003601 RepID=A0ABY7JMM9_9FIRM|nr:macro domain-containing protein [Peptostreptococcus sp. CBA3647]WAW14592.1 macro domain-containing protein [Peptostreptococcus sp. CBA3647]